MKGMTIIFLILAKSAFAQLTNEGKYNWDYVSKRIKESNSLTAATKLVISEIAVEYNSETEQKELIKFYKDAYDYKIVDKTV
jgi:hypothetical protein